MTQEGPQRRAFIAAEEKNSATCAEWEEGVTEIFHVQPETLQNKCFFGKAALTWRWTCPGSGLGVRVATLTPAWAL